MDGDGRKEPGLPSPVDLCKLTPYQRQRQKDACLAKPKGSFSRSSLGAPAKRQKGAAELITKCSPHTEMLAMPKAPLPKLNYVTKAEKEAEREIREEMTKEELKWLMRKPFPQFVSGVKKSALTAVCTPRLEVIAMAKLKPLVINKKLYFDKLAKTQREALARHIKENLEDFQGRYPPESDKMYEIVNGVVVHASCAGKETPKSDCKKMLLCELNKNQRKLFRKRMKAMSVPRIRQPPTTGPDRGPKKKIKEFEPWLTLISQPRFNASTEVHYDPFEVKASAKGYVATERILEMARPKTVPPPPPLFDMEGNELPPRREWSFNSRKRIIASPRTLELATPRFVKKKAAEDTKEDPFAVPRRALTAFCTERTKELAEPRKRA